MADLGFLPIVRRLLESTPADGQRMLFSATLDAAIDVLVRRFLQQPGDALGQRELLPGRDRAPRAHHRPGQEARGAGGAGRRRQAVAGVHQDQARRRAARPPAHRARHPRRRTAREPAAGRPRAEPGGVLQRHRPGHGRHRHRRPRHPRRRHRPGHPRRPARRAQGVRAPLGPHRPRRRRRRRGHAADAVAGARGHRDDAQGRHHPAAPRLRTTPSRTCCARSAARPRPGSRSRARSPSWSGRRTGWPPTGRRPRRTRRLRTGRPGRSRDDRPRRDRQGGGRYGSDRYGDRYSSDRRDRSTGDAARAATGPRGSTATATPARFRARRATARPTTAIDAPRDRRRPSGRSTATSRAPRGEFRATSGRTAAGRGGRSFGGDRPSSDGPPVPRQPRRQERRRPAARAERLVAPREPAGQRKRPGRRVPAARRGRRLATGRSRRAEPLGQRLPARPRQQERRIGRREPRRIGSRRPPVGGRPTGRGPGPFRLFGRAQRDPLDAGSPAGPTFLTYLRWQRARESDQFSGPRTAIRAAGWGRLTLSCCRTLRS